MHTHSSPPPSQAATSGLGGGQDMLHAGGLVLPWFFRQPASSHEACSQPGCTACPPPWLTLLPPGVPSPSGPLAPGLGSCSCPGRPATSSAPLPLAPPCCPRSAASLALCQAAWEPSPGRANFPAECV